MKKTISICLSLVLLLSTAITSFAAGNDNFENEKITIKADELYVALENVDKNIMITETNNSLVTLMDFFDENGMDSSFYINWIKQQNLQEMDEISFYIQNDNSNSVSVLNSSDIQADRIVYVDTTYEQQLQKNSFSSGELMKNAITEAVVIVISNATKSYSEVINSLATFLGITNPSSYFQGDKEKTADWKWNHWGGIRTVTKFVELYAPVSGVVKWYPWASAQSDYSSYYAQLMYKGATYGSVGEKYKQKYTKNYYVESTLKQKARAAYPSSNYNETVSEYAASVGGYTLHSRTINKTTYFEYNDVAQ